MSDPTDRPVFVWLVLVLCVVYTGFFVFTAYVSARSYGLVKKSGWSARPDDKGCLKTTFRILYCIDHPIGICDPACTDFQKQEQARCD